MKKYCAKCKREIDLFYFNKNKKSEDGHQAYCRDCYRFMHRIMYLKKKYKDPQYHKSQAHKKYWKNPERGREIQRNFRLRDPKRYYQIMVKSHTRYKNDLDLTISRLYTLIKQRLKHNKHYVGRGFNVCSREDFLDMVYNDPNILPIFELWKKHGNVRWLAPTIDRIDNNRGYDIDNIQVLSYVDNTIKALQEIKERYK